MAAVLVASAVDLVVQNAISGTFPFARDERRQDGVACYRGSPASPAGLPVKV